MTRHLIIALALLLSLAAIGLRFLNLNADPPIELADFGQSLVTDPYFHTAYARDAVLFDEPLKDDGGFNIYKHSLISYAAKLLFDTGGVSRTTANLTSVLLNLVGILLFVTAVYDERRKRLPLFVAFFLLVNPLMTVFSRYPLLENGLVFLVGLVCFLFFEFNRSQIGLIFTGIAVALAALAGKLFGVMLLVPVLAGVLYIHKRRSLFPVIGVLMGFVLGSAAYLLATAGTNFESMLVYLTAVDTTTAARPALQSPYAFLQSFMTWLPHSRMPQFFALLIPAALAGLFVALSERRSFKSSGEMLPLIFSVVWLLVGITMFSLIEYRPVRYSIIMYFPLALLAGNLCERLLDECTLGRPKSVWGWVTLFVAPLFLLPVLPAVFVNVVTAVKLVADFVWFFVGAAVLGLAALIIFWRKEDWNLSPLVRNVVLAFVLVVSAGQAGFYGYRLFGNPTFEFSRINHELSELISPDAFLAGNFAPALTIDTKLRTLPTFFGPRQTDPGLFVEYPATHLATSPALWQRDQDFYSLRGRGSLLFRKSVSNSSIDLYRLERWGYLPTRFEQAMESYVNGDMEQAQIAIDSFVLEHPTNATARMFAAELMLTLGVLDSAQTLAMNLVRDFPTSFNVQLFGSVVFANVYKQSGEPVYRDEAESLYGRAIALMPGAEMRFDEFLAGL